MNCPFCDSENIKNQIFYEDEIFYGLYNIKPIVPGHSLLIPKRHVEHLLELNDEEMKMLLPVLKKIIKGLLKTYDADSFDLSLQEGKPAGQMVPHLHVHLIPRVLGDLQENWPEALAKREKGKRISDEEIKENAEKIKRFLKAKK
jgi:bis(5'-adenosyl)-triphosphatase